MKIKALRYKKEYNPHQEFVHIVVKEGYNNVDIFTSSLPKIQPETATIEEMDADFKDWGCEVDFEPYELVEFHLVEANTIGADIRNKLSPSLNIISLVKFYLNETDEIKKGVLERYLEKEMEKSKENIEYISNLL
jgi:hypothetical protein